MSTPPVNKKMFDNSQKEKLMWCLDSIRINHIATSQWYFLSSGLYITFQSLGRTVLKSKESSGLCRLSRYSIVSIVNVGCRLRAKGTIRISFSSLSKCCWCHSILFWLPLGDFSVKSSTYSSGCSMLAWQMKLVYISQKGWPV